MIHFSLLMDNVFIFNISLARCVLLLLVYFIYVWLELILLLNDKNVCEIFICVGCEHLFINASLMSFYIVVFMLFATLFITSTNYRVFLNCLNTLTKIINS